MAKKITGKFVKEVEIIDPDTKAPVTVSIFKLETGGMIGIDESFIANTDLPIYSPFDKNIELDLDI